MTDDDRLPEPPVREWLAELVAEHQRELAAQRRELRGCAVLTVALAVAWLAVAAGAAWLWLR